MYVHVCMSVYIYTYVLPCPSKTYLFNMSCFLGRFLCDVSRQIESLQGVEDVGQFVLL